MQIVMRSNLFLSIKCVKLTSEKCCHVTRTSPPGTLETLGPSLVAVHLLKLSVPYQNCTLNKIPYLLFTFIN